MHACRSTLEDPTPVGELGKALLVALDPDRIAATALATAQARGITRNEETLTAEELQEARDQRVAAACAPFDAPELRDQIETARREREQLIDHVNLDQVTFVGFTAQAEDEARKVITTFHDYLAAHRDEIAALGFFYQQPYQRRALTFEMIEELHERLARPPLMLTTERLWNAYARIHTSRVQGADRRRQLTDLVSLLRFASGLSGADADQMELRPFADEVDKRFADWVFRHNAQRATAFTPEQMDWLRLMKDHVAASCAIGRPHFSLGAFAAKGGLQKAWGVFGGALDPLMEEMNLELVA